MFYYFETNPRANRVETRGIQNVPRSRFHKKFICRQFKLFLNDVLRCITVEELVLV